MTKIYRKSYSQCSKWNIERGIRYGNLT